MSFELNQALYVPCPKKNIYIYNPPSVVLFILRYRFFISKYFRVYNIPFSFFVYVQSSLRVIAQKCNPNSIIYERSPPSDNIWTFTQSVLWSSTLFRINSLRIVILFIIHFVNTLYKPRNLYYMSSKTDVWLLQILMP